MKSTKQQPSRKPPALSAEEELAELLADPTLQPSITFLGLRESTTPYPDTEPVPGTEAVSDNVSALDSSNRILFNSARPRSPRLLQTVPAPVALPTAEVPTIETVAPSVSIPPTDSVSPPAPVAGSVSVAPTESVAALELVSPPLSASGLPKRSTPGYQRPKARPALTVEDGHSHIEQHIYDSMWRVAEPQGSDTRVLTIGFGAMSHLVRLSLNNCRLNVRSLIRKLAVEELREELCQQSVGKTYLIYSPEAILRRRRQAGLEWVVRTRGVLFVNPATGLPLEGQSS